MKCRVGGCFPTAASLIQGQYYHVICDGVRLDVMQFRPRQAVTYQTWANAYPRVPDGDANYLFVQSVWVRS